MAKAQSLEETLGSVSEAWAEWFAWLRKQLRHSIAPSGTLAATWVRAFLGLSVGMPLSEALRETARCFGIQVVSNRGHSVAAPAEGWVTILQAWDIFRTSEIHLAIGPGSKGRRSAVFAHELGHLFYVCIQIVLSGETQELKGRHRDVEKFCWDFSVEFACPFELRNNWTYAQLEASLDSSTLSTLARSDGTHGIITYWHLRGLASKYGISIRMAIVALNKHRILAEPEQIIALFRLIPNRFSGKEPALRLINQARSSRIYLIPNQRAEHQGFAGAKSIFQSALSGTYNVIVETIKLRIKEQCNVPWASASVSTACVYTPVDVKGEGRYLIASFSCRAVRPERQPKT